MDDIVYHVGDTIETTNNNGFRVYKKIKFVTAEVARQLITSRFKSVFNNIKSIVITEKNIHEDHKNFLKMKTSGHTGIASERLVNQHNKILILKQEIEQSGIEYDFVFRSRLDHLFLTPLILSNYNLSKNIVYTPGFEGNRDLCYDWYIFGEATTVLNCMNLFNELDCDNKLYVIRSNCCPLTFIKENKPCIHGKFPSDVTIASEVQLARMCKESGILIQHSRMQGFVYRYCIDSINQTVKDVLPKGLTGIKWVDYTAGPDVFYAEL